MTAVQPAPSAQRAIEIVTFLAEHTGETFAVADLARRLEHNRTTCQAVLHALEEAGWVRRGPGGYAIGAALIPLGTAAQRGVPVVELVVAAVDELHADVGREVMGWVPLGAELLAVARAGSNEPFSVTMHVGQTFPLAPPFGLAVVAWHADELDRWMGRAPGVSAQQRDQLRQAAALVRELGYCVTLDPATRRALGRAIAELARHPGSAEARARRAELMRALTHDEYVTVSRSEHRSMRASQISAPVFGADGVVVAVIGIILASEEHEALPGLAAKLLRSTSRLTTSMAGPDLEEVSSA